MLVSAPSWYPTRNLRPRKRPSLWKPRRPPLARTRPLKLGSFRQTRPRPLHPSPHAMMVLASSERQSPTMSKSETEMGINSWLEDELRQQYRHDRSTVDESWKRLFENSNGATTNGAPSTNGAATNATS